MDSQTCTRFSAKVGHESKDSWFTVRANGQKGGVAVGVACHKKVHNFYTDTCNMAKLCRPTHMNTHPSNGHGLPRPPRQLINQLAAGRSYRRFTFAYPFIHFMSSGLKSVWGAILCFYVAKHDTRSPAVRQKSVTCNVFADVSPYCSPSSAQNGLWSG